MTVECSATKRTFIPPSLRLGKYLSRTNREGGNKGCEVLSSEHSSQELWSPAPGLQKTQLGNRKGSREEIMSAKPTATQKALVKSCGPQNNTKRQHVGKGP